MQSVFFKLHYFVELPGAQFNTCFRERCLAGTGCRYWLWKEESYHPQVCLNMLEYVADQSLETSPSHPVCLFMWLGRLAPKLGPNPSFTLAIPAVRRVGLLSLNGCRQTEATLLHSEVHSFITFIPQTCIEEPCVRLGREGRLITVQALP